MIDVVNDGVIEVPIKERLPVEALVAVIMNFDVDDTRNRMI